MSTYMPFDYTVHLERIARSLEAIETHLSNLVRQPRGAHVAKPRCDMCGDTGYVTVGDFGQEPHQETCPDYACTPF